MKASIDIGTNTVLLLIAEVKGENIHVIHEEQRIPRLGQGVDAASRLSEKAINRVTGTLKEYRQIIENDFKAVEQVKVSATSATRDAVNKQELLDRIEEESGWKVKVLNGKEEAEYTFRGALSVLKDLHKKETLVLDIGGGSTEVILGKNGKIKKAISYDMGCVRFTERYLLNDPPLQQEVTQCRHAIRFMFNSRKVKPSGSVTSVGVAGTLTSLAALNLKPKYYNRELINGFFIDREKLSKAIDIFSHHTREELFELSPHIMKGREDIFLAGLLILEGFLNHFDLPFIKVSTGGVRHGALLVN